MQVQLGPMAVRWTGGGLLLVCEGSGLLLDAPERVVDSVGPDLARIHCVLLTGDRTRAVVGLVPLLAALERHRLPDLPLEVRFPLGAERGAMLAETWVRGWPDRYPVTLDAEAPGSSFAVGPFAVESLPIRTGEPLWATDDVVASVGMGVRVSAGGRTLAWVPASAPHRHVQRLCAGVDLAVVEVGREPWPRTAERWRLSVAEAMEACADAKEVWLPGDDGLLDVGPPT